MAEDTRSAPWTALFGFTNKAAHGAILSVAIALAVASGAAAPAVSLLLGKIFDKFTEFAASSMSPGDFLAGVGQFSGYLALVGLASLFLNGGRFMCWLLFGELQAENSRTEIFRSLQTKSVKWFELDGSGIGSILSRAHTHIGELQIATSQPMGSLLHSMAVAISSLTLALAFCWKLTIVILAMIPVSGLVLGLLSKLSQSSITTQQGLLLSATKVIQTAFTNIETVKSMNGEGVEGSKYARFITKAARAFTRLALGSAAETAFMRFVVIFSFVPGFWYGQHLVANGEASFGTVVTTFWSCLSITQVMEAVLPQLVLFEKGLSAGAILKQLLQPTWSANSLPQHQRPEIPSREGSLAFHNVSFAYPSRPEAIVLRNFSALFHYGMTTFVVGQSGSGKSTIAQLLLAFYSPTSGSISLGGVPISQIDLQRLRETITLVDQQSVLFSGSIGDNIALGKIGPPASLEEIKSAAQFARLHDTIESMPSGYDTIIEAQGASLSGGQKQRVALARARLRDTPILILDESTSALDQHNHTLVMKEIRKWRQSKTTIIITHDWSQIDADDFVYFLRDGKTIKAGMGGELENSFSLKAPRHSSKIESDSRTAPVAVPRTQGSVSVDTSIQAPDPDLPSSSRRPLSRRSSGAVEMIPRIFIAGSRNQPTMAMVPQPASPSTIDTQWSASASPTATLAPLLSSPDRQNFMPSSPLQAGMPSGLTDARGFQDFDFQLEPIRERPTDEAVRPYFDDEALFMTQTEQVSANHSFRKILRTVWPSLRGKYRLMLLLGFLGVSIHAALTPVFSWVFSRLLSTFVQPQTSQNEALIWAISIIAIAVTDAGATFAMFGFLDICGQAWVDSIRMKAVRRILEQPKLWYHKEENNPSVLLSTLDQCADAMRDLVGRFCSFILVAFIVMTMAMVWSAATCYQLTFVGLAICPVFFCAARGFQNTSAKMEALCNNKAEACATIMQEAFSNVKTVRALTLEPKFESRHANHVRKTFRAGVRRAIYCGCFFGLSESLIMFTEALIFYYGAVLVAGSHYSVEQILLVFSMLLFGLSNVAILVGYIPQIASSKETAARLLDLCDLTDVSHERIGYNVPSHAGDIKIRDLTFAYPSCPMEPVLREVSFDIAEGKITALVGASGSGKSTIASLLLRLFSTAPPSHHSLPCITIGGQDIMAMSVKHLRAQVALVPQSPVVFPGSIADNITYALLASSAHATTAAVKRAARLAGLHDFAASLPAGYATVIGDGGVGLSGGQAQRVAIARALVREPRVLILDEGTSALDPDSAAAVRDALRGLVRRVGLTVLAITHAREVMAAADRVVMLDGGRVVEEGAFGELMEREGPLAEMLGRGQRSI